MAIDGLLRGCRAMKSFMLVTMADLFIRVIASYFMLYLLGNPIGIWLAWPISWVLSILLSGIFYFNGKWKKRIPKFM